ncbi:MAG: efflux transporter outer membrane subunit, partial [Desulfobaccales bacterium]
MKTNPTLFCIPALLAVCGFLFLPLSGCMVGPDYQAPHLEAPAAWAGVTEAPAPRPTSVASGQPAELAQWWKRFKDPTLTQLVEDALKTNLNLELAVANLRQARAARGIAIAGLWPVITGSAEYLRETTSGVTSPSKGSTGAAAPAGQSQNLYQAGFDALWEIDVFGGQRRNVESASANVQAAMEGISNVQVTIAAEVALDYVQLRGYQQQIAITRKNLKAMQNTALITRQKMGAGFASALDVANAEASVATTEAQIPVFETSARQSIYALSILLARPPADLLEQLTPTGNVPGVPAQVPAGLPSDLLRRRPDIRQAEAQLH